MEKRKLVLIVIGVIILAMVITVYIYFSKSDKDEKKNQQTINRIQTVQQKTDEKKENTEKNTSGDENAGIFCDWRKRRILWIRTF